MGARDGRVTPDVVLTSKAGLLRRWPAYLAYLALLLVISLFPVPTFVLSNAFQHGNRFDETAA